jgi:hypothetical protein
MIEGYYDFPTGYDFLSSRPITDADAIVTANWRGCGEVLRYGIHAPAEEPMVCRLCAGGGSLERTRL